MDPNNTNNPGGAGSQDPTVASPIGGMPPVGQQPADPVQQSPVEPVSTGAWNSPVVPSPGDPVGQPMGVSQPVEPMVVPPGPVSPAPNMGAAMPEEPKADSGDAGAGGTTPPATGGY